MVLKKHFVSSRREICRPIFPDNLGKCDLVLVQEDKV